MLIDVYRNRCLHWIGNLARNATRTHLGCAMNAQVASKYFGLRVELGPPKVIYSHSDTGAGINRMAIALSTERRVLLLRVLPRTSPGHCGKNVSLEEMLIILEAAVSAKSARCYVSNVNSIISDDDTETERNEKNQIYIAEIKRDPKNRTVTLLINRGNPNAVAPALVTPSSNDVTYIKPSKDQTPGASAHLVISTEWTGGFHAGALEKMAHVATSLTQAAINAIISRATAGDPKYIYEYQTKKGKKTETVRDRYAPIVILERMPSEKLRTDLDRGELSAITLTKKVTAYNGIGPKQQIRYQEQKLVIHTTHKDASAMRKLIEGVETFGKEQKYESITLHIEKLPNGQTSSPTLQFSETEDALEILYSRAKVINGFDILLEGLYESICPQIEAKIIALLVGAPV